VIEESTRTALARIALPNRGLRWRPGTFIRARITTGSHQVPVAVPRSAIQQHEGGPVVFVRQGDIFSPRPVTLGVHDDERVAISSGLAAGESCAADGSFTIKAELGKNAFGSGHSH